MFKRLSFLFVALFLLSAQSAFGQEYEYGESLDQARVSRDKDFRDARESPLELEDFAYFKSLAYFPSNPNYKVEARFVRTPSEKKFEMPTMNGKSKTAVKYAEAKFTLNGREYRLGVYQLEKLAQSEKYKRYLFIPFKDITNGKETYGGGRYIDFEIPAGDTITIDFNRAYNPSCAYNKAKFSCPVPPTENHLKARIEAGEKAYKKTRYTKAAHASFVDQPQSRFASFDKMRVHYLNAGKGSDALIFIHGWTCNTNFWKGQIGAFKNIRVIAIDLPGHGESDKPQNVSYTMELFARSIEAVMKDAGVKRAVLVGHSMGTPVAREFYRLYPAKTPGLVIVDGALRPYGTKEEREKFFAPLNANYKENAPKFLDVLLGPITNAELKSEIRTSMLATPEHVALSAMEGMNDEKIWKQDKINVPVLAVMAKSPFWPSDIENIYRSIAPNLDFQMWDGVSHFLMMEKPDEFNKALMAFLVKNKTVK